MNTRTSRLLQAGATAAVAATLLMGCNKAPEAGGMPLPSPTSLNTDVADSVITASVKTALLSDAVVKGLDVQVETRKGAVLLSGFVDSQAQISQAGEVARGVSGVTSVENSITLKAGPNTAATEMDDTAVTGRVKTALLADPAVKSFDISVLTSQGAVQLTGFVDNQAQIDKASSIARAAEGTKSVKNELTIKK